MLNFPFRGDLCHSHTHVFCAEALARRSAFVLEVPIGALQVICVASLANSSALSFPLMLEWPISTVCVAL